MAEIKTPNPGGANIPFSEIHIPDDNDLGTGTFTVHLTPNALKYTSTGVGGSMVNIPIFQISATFTSKDTVVVVIGRADGSPPKHQATFLMPPNVDSSRPHDLTVKFAKWYILGAYIDGVSLAPNIGGLAH